MTRETHMRMFDPPHPGAVLREWLGDLPVTDVANHLGISRVTLSRVLNARNGISPEMDLRLAQALGTSAGSWLAMQKDYELWQAQKSFKLRIKRLKLSVRAA